MKYLPNREPRPFELSEAVNNLIRGYNNAFGQVTLTASATTTTVSSDLIHENSTPVLTPTTANAAAEIGNGTLYISNVTAGSFEITHANNSQTDRTYRYTTSGG